MATYEYKCEACEAEFQKRMPMSQSSDPQDCPDCGATPARKLISAGAGFILKGDGWSGKDLKVNRQMAKKNQKLDAKREGKKRELGVQLSPNVGGERTDSWSEASKLAASKGKDTSGYDKRASAEKKT